MALENALAQFERAEENAIICGNKGNVSLLREAQQCLKVWIEKRENKGNEKRGSQQSEGSRGSDESLDDKNE